MAAISSGQVMAWPVSASTRAAAASALGFGVCGVGLLAGAGATALVLPAWAGGGLGACFFLAFMELLLGEGIGTHRQRACHAAHSRVRTVTSPGAKGSSPAYAEFCFFRGAAPVLASAQARACGGPGLPLPVDPAAEDGVPEMTVGRPAPKLHPAIALRLHPARRLRTGHYRARPP